MKATFTDVRLALRKGEQAIEILEKLGYTYSAQPNTQPKWLEPLNSTTDSELVEKIRQLLNPCEVKGSGYLKELAEQVVTGQRARAEQPPVHPEGRKFLIIPGNLPPRHFSSLPFGHRVEVKRAVHTEAVFYSSRHRVTFRYHFPGDQEPTLLWVPRNAVRWQEANPNDSVRH